MKLKVLDIIALNKLLYTVNLALVKAEMFPVVKICTEMQPCIMEYENAMRKYYKDIEGKKIEDPKTLPSYNVLMALADKDVEINTTLTQAQADNIKQNLFTVTGTENIQRNAADYMLLDKLVEKEKPKKKK